MVEVINYSQLYTEDIAFGTTSREVRLQNGALVTAQQFDPGWELAYRTGDLRQHVGKGRAILISRPTEVNAALTIPEGDVLLFTPGGSLVLNAPVTCQGHIDAGRYQIFSGAQAITLPRQEEIFPEWWGADPTGVLASGAAFNKALAAMTQGGRLLGLGPNAVYLFSAALADITRSNIIIDMQNAACVSPTTGSFFTWVTFTGDVGIAGDYSGVIENCAVRNVRIGTANTTSHHLSPPRFEWSKNCSMTNIHVKGKQGGFNIEVSDFFTMLDCSIIGVSPTQFPLFQLYGNFCVYKNIFIDLENQAEGGGLVQIKGGRFNTLENVNIRNVVHAGDALYDQCFYIRGDSPWSTSDTNPATHTYPFTTLFWDVPDARRASHGTRLLNCTVQDAPTMDGYRLQEDTETSLINCRAFNVFKGVVAARITNGAERDLQIIGGHFETCGIACRLGASGVGIRVQGVLDAYPRVKIIGVTVRNCAQEGIHLDRVDTLILDDCIVNDAGNALVSGSQIGISVAGLSSNLSITQCVATDTRAGILRTQDIGINVAQAALGIRLTGNRASNNISYDIHSWLPGEYAQNNPGEGTAVTTNATPVTDRLRFQLAAEQTVWFEVEAIARKPATSDCAYYKVGALFSTLASTLSKVGSDHPLLLPGTLTSLTDNSGGTATDTIAAITTGGAAADQSPTRDAVADLAAKTNAIIAGFSGIETTATWGGLALILSSNEVAIQLTGLAATTINWVIKARCTIL